MKYLDHPEDIVAVLHETSGMILCHNCIEDMERKQKGIFHYLVNPPIFASACSKSSRCEACHEFLLTYP